MKRFLHKSFLLSVIFALSFLFTGSIPVDHTRAHSEISLKEGEGNPVINRRVVLVNGIRLQSDLQTWYNKLSTKPSKPLLKDLNNMMKALEAEGILSAMDVFHPIGGLETDEQRLTPIITVSGDDFVPVNSPTLDVYGVTSDGSSSYLDLKYNCSADGTNVGTTNYHLAFYCGTNVDSGSKYECGSYTGVVQVERVGSRISSSTGYYWIVTNNSSTGVLTSASSSGFWQYDKNGTTGTANRNGTQVGTKVFSTYSFSSYDYFLCNYNNAGSPTTPVARRYSLISIGAALTTKISEYNTIITNYMIARGINV